MPILEAFADENQMMRSKLISLPKNTVKLPLVEAGVSSITLNRPGLVSVIHPSTSNVSNGNRSLGYTCILSNANMATISVAPGGEVENATTYSAIGDNAANSVSIVGTKFNITAKSVTADASTTITIIGNETGGTITIPLTIKKDPTIDIITKGL